MNSKKGQRLLPVIPMFLILFFLSACGAQDTGGNSNGESSGGTTELVLSHTSAPDTPIYLTYEKFKEEVEENSNGEITIKIHHSSTLAGDTQGVEMLGSGTLDIASAGTNNMSTFTDNFLVFDLPYIFENVESAYEVLSGEVGQEIKATYEEESGYKLLFYADTGSQRDVMNTVRQVKSPEDMSGLKFRSAESPIEIATIQKLGAVATPISWVEVYSALEQGVVNGELQQYHWAVTANHQEVIKHVTETGGIQAVHLAIMNGEKFSSLSQEHQDIIMEASQAAQEYNFSEAPALLQGLRQTMIDAGVQIYEPTDEELEIWKETAIPVWDEFTDVIPEDLIQRIVEAQE